MSSTPIKKRFCPHQIFSKKNLYSVECGTLCSKSEVILMCPYVCNHEPEVDSNSGKGRRKKKNDLSCT